MGWQALLVEMTKALAWPLVVVLTVLFLRDSIRRLIALVSKVKYGDLEIQFARQMLEAESIADDLPTPPARLTGEDKEGPSVAIQIEADPRATILLAWLRIESELLRVAKEIFKAHGKPEHRPGIGDAINVLVKNEKLNPRTASLIQELRVLRNEAAHAIDLQLSQEESARYVDLANKVLRLLHAPPFAGG